MASPDETKRQACEAPVGRQKRKEKTAEGGARREGEDVWTKSRGISLTNDSDAVEHSLNSTRAQCARCLRRAARSGMMRRARMGWASAPPPLSNPVACRRKRRRRLKERTEVHLSSTSEVDGDVGLGLELLLVGEDVVLSERGQGGRPGGLEERLERGRGGSSDGGGEHGGRQRDLLMVCE